MAAGPDDIDIAVVAAQAPVAWAVTDLEGRHVMGNSAYAALFGRSREDAIAGVPLGDLDIGHGSDSLADVQALIRGTVETHEFDRTYLRSDGSSFVGHVVSSLLRTSSGDPLAVIRVVSDVTLERRQSTALALSHERMAKMLVNISDTVTLVDAEGRITSTTGFHKEVLGHPRTFWRSSSIFELAHPDDRGESERLASEVLERPGTEVSGEFRARHAAGHYETLEVSAVNLLDDPAVAAIVITSRNVTHRKEVERELASVRDRAVTLAEQRAALVASVSHELRTPLHAVLGLAELLADRLEDPDLVEYVGGIRREARQLQTTVDDLLEYSRFESRGIVLEAQPVALEPLLERVVRRSAAALHASGLDIRTDLDEGVPSAISTDAHRLEQLLTNLVGNAVKFTSEGRVTVGLSAPSPARIRFTVADTGPGIPQSHRELVFAPFVQAPGRPSAGGTGLGLALVKELTDLMGGEVELDCPAEGGTVVTVEIPAVQVDAPAVVDEPDLDHAAIRGGASVLVVEDTPVNQLLVRQQLERLGHRPTIVSTAGEGLERLSRPAHGYDLVLMDWQLPDFDGLEATRRLRSAEHGTETHVPVVAMTASAMPEDRAACRDAGMDDFLAKPVGLRDLARVIDLWTPTRDAQVLPGTDPTVPRTGEVLDHEALAILVDDLGDREVVVSLVVRFLAELDQRRQAVIEAFDRADVDVVHRVGHTLRSTGEMMGAVALKDLCRELEALSDIQADRELLDRFLAAVEQAREALQNWATTERTEAP